MVTRLKNREFLDSNLLLKLRYAKGRGLRNGNWRRLSLVDRGLFRCALWIAKTRGQIASFRLMVTVARIMLRLLETQRTRILKAGRARADQLRLRFDETGLFQWAPKVRGWLLDQRYVFYLGLGGL